MLEEVANCVIDGNAGTLAPKTADAGDIMNSLLAPASQSLCHQWNVGHTLSLASLIVSGHFSLFTHLQGEPLGVGRS